MNGDKSETPTSPAIRFRDVLAALYADAPGRVELRVIRIGQERPVARDFFTLPADVERIAAFCQRHANDELYLGVALRDESGSGGLDNCTLATALFCDLDFKMYAGGEAEARQRLTECPIPPSLVIASGGGLHVYWFLVEPLILPTDKSVATGMLRRLGGYLGGDLASAEPAHVLRVVGGRNHKYEPARSVTVELFDPSRRYALSHFDWLPSEPDAASARSAEAASEQIGGGERKRNSSLHAMGRSAKAHGANEATITALLFSANLQCTPAPLDDAEVRRIIASVMHEGDRADFAGRDRKPEPAAGRAPLVLTTIGDLLAEPDETTDWVVADRIPAGSLILLVGKPKTGKSTTARDLAFARATGDYWLGHACQPGPVWYLALEEKRGEVSRHFRQMGARPDDPIRIFCGQAPVDIIPQLHALAAKDDGPLIVVDPIQRLIRARDLNDYAETTSKFDPLLQLARQTGATLVLLHHGGKGERAGIDSILGSTALAGSVDNVLLLSRTDRARVLSSVQRIGPDLEPTIVLLDAVTGRVTLGETLNVFETERVAGLILAALRASVQPLTQPEIEDVVPGKTRLKRWALRELLRREQVTRAGTGGRNSAFRYSIVEPCSLVPPIEQEQRFNVPAPAYSPAFSEGTETEPRSLVSVPQSIVVPGSTGLLVRGPWTEI